MSGAFAEKIKDVLLALALAAVAGFSLSSPAWGSEAGANAATDARPPEAATPDEPTTTAAGDAIIQVRSVAQVDGKTSEITFGDLMVAHGVSSTAMERLKPVRLADAPNAGESRSFTAMGLEDVIRPHLRAIADTTGEQIALRIPTRVTVVRKPLHLGNEEIESELKAQLKEFCADCTFEIAGLSLPVIPASVPTGASWKIRLRGEIPKGSFSLPLEIANDDGTRRIYWISGLLTVRREMPVASRTLQIGEKLRPEDFTKQLREITFASDVAPSEAEMGSSVIARQVPAGQIVWRGALRREMAVKVGDIVKVSAGEGEWQITIDGVAQGGGYIGDLVNVKIPRTQKQVSGVLVAKGVVEVR